MGRVEASLNEVLALWLGDEGLELRSGERVDEAGLGHDKQEYLCAGEGRELIGLEARRARRKR